MLDDFIQHLSAKTTPQHCIDVGELNIFYSEITSVRFPCRGLCSVLKSALLLVPSIFRLLNMPRERRRNLNNTIRVSVPLAFLTHPICLHHWEAPFGELVLLTCNLRGHLVFQLKNYISALAHRKKLPGTLAAHFQEASGDGLAL